MDNEYTGDSETYDIHSDDQVPGEFEDNGIIMNETNVTEIDEGTALDNEVHDEADGKTNVKLAIHHPEEFSVEAFRMIIQRLNISNTDNPNADILLEIRDKYMDAIDDLMCVQVAELDELLSDLGGDLEIADDADDECPVYEKTAIRRQLASMECQKVALHACYM